MTSDESTEQAIIATKTSTTPRVTPDDIEASIAKELFFTAGQAARGLNLPASPSDDLLTFCVLTLRNGFTVTGESVCVSAENFSAQIGRDIARQNAVAKVWPLIERAAFQVGQGAAPGSEQLPPAMPDVRQNTSPAFPPVPDDGASPMAGIETPIITDNIGE